MKGWDGIGYDEDTEWPRKIDRWRLRVHTVSGLKTFLPDVGRRRVVNLRGGDLGTGFGLVRDGRGRAYLKASRTTASWSGPAIRVPARG